jgi:hypothetical protein
MVAIAEDFAFSFGLGVTFFVGLSVAAILTEKFIARFDL